MTTADLSLDALERIARIIDPSSWRILDGYLADVKRQYKGQDAAYDPEAFKDKASMAKAKEILAFIAAARTKSPDPRPAGEEVAETVKELRDAYITGTRRGELAHRAADMLSTLSAERDAMEGLIVKWRAEAKSDQAFVDGGGMNRAMAREFADKARVLNSCAFALKTALEHKGETDA